MGSIPPAKQCVIVVCILLCMLLGSCNTDIPEDNGNINITEEFVPNNQWQVVKKGQAVPQGLHVRLNFETGVTEAKLLDLDDKSTSMTFDPSDYRVNATYSPHMTRRTHRLASDYRQIIDQALANLPKKKDEASSEIKIMSLNHVKIDYEKIRMVVNRDVDVMHNLFHKYEVVQKLFQTSNMLKDKTNQESVNSFISVEMLNILTDVEFLVHQHDNGVEFVRLNGLEKMVYPHLNASDVTLKAEALKLMGSCLQNNIKAKIYALETNGGEHLLKVLALDKNEHVKEKAMFALGALVRSFPLAQIQIINDHGIDVLTKILLSDNPGYVKLKLKVLSLLEDLVMEQTSFVEFETYGDPGVDEKVRQYFEVDLLRKLTNPTTCQILGKVLSDCFEEDSSNMDNMFQIFSAIKTFSHICKHHHYKDRKLLLLFHKLQVTYTRVVRDREREKMGLFSEGPIDDTEFYLNILDVIDSYIAQLNDAKIKDEL